MSDNVVNNWQQVVSNATKVIIWGAGDQGRVNIPILRSLNIEIAAFIDESDKCVSPIADVPLFSNFNEFRESLSAESFLGIKSVIAIGNPYGEKRAAYTKLLDSLGISSLSFADPTARIRADVKIGSGLQVMAGATICNNVIVGDNCIINTNALIEHDCILESEIEVGPGAILTGRVTLKHNSWVGAGAVLLPRVTVGENSIVGAGAVVTKNVPANVVVIGTPARIFRSV